MHEGFKFLEIFSDNSCFWAFMTIFSMFFPKISCYSKKKFCQYWPKVKTIPKIGQISKLFPSNYWRIIGNIHPWNIHPGKDDVVNKNPKNSAILGNQCLEIVSMLQLALLKAFIELFFPISKSLCRGWAF